MPDTEERAVLDLDSSNTLAAIYQALSSYARTIPDSAVTKIIFEQQPDVSRKREGTIWKAGVRLRCFGELRRTISVDGEDHIEPVLVREEHWEAEGLGFAGAVEELRDVVEGHLQNLIAGREHDLQAAREALLVLRNPVELSTMWAIEEPRDVTPQESQ